MNHGWSIDRPLHDSNVRLSQRQELCQGEERSSVPVGQHVLHVEQLEGGAGGLEDEDEEEGDEGEPEVWWSESSGAASSALDEESEPGDDEEDHGQHEGEDEGGDVEVDAGGGSPVNRGVHADGGVVGATSDDVLVWILAPWSHLGEECAGDSEESGEEPDHGDEDGVRPGSGHVLALSPLGVLHEQMIGQEEQSEREEEEEAVVEISEEENIISWCWEWFIMLDKFVKSKALLAFRPDLILMMPTREYWEKRMQFCRNNF